MTDMDKMMIEKVARAIAASFQSGSPDIAKNMRMDWYAWEPEARAAIAAWNTRNPDDRLSRVGTLFAAIEHGDEEHRAWLKEAIDKHFAGEAVPAPRGNGNSDRLREALLEASFRLNHAPHCNHRKPLPNGKPQPCDCPTRALVLQIDAALSPLPQGDG